MLRDFLRDSEHIISMAAPVYSDSYLLVHVICSALRNDALTHFRTVANLSHARLSLGIAELDVGTVMADISRKRLNPSVIE